METTDIIGVVLGEISFKYIDITTSEWSDSDGPSRMVRVGPTVQESRVDKLGPCKPISNLFSKSYDFK